MLRNTALLRTKLLPPRLHHRVLPRPSLSKRLGDAVDYRLTLVQAGTGYGKSTALAALADNEPPLFWYNVDEADADPQRFLSYLIGAFSLNLHDMPDTPQVVLQELSSEASPKMWSQVLDAFINSLTLSLGQPSLLVVDDYHLVANSAEVNELLEYFIHYLPHDLHLIVSSRYPLSSLMITTWRAKGEVLEIGREDLAFRPEEIDALFRETYGMQLSADELAVLTDKTEGWPIALQLVWQGLRNASARSAAEILEHGPGSLSALFDYLALDVMDRQPDEIQTFLRQTAVLLELTPNACDALTGNADGAEMLAHLRELDLFVVELGEQNYRYHHLFHDFLLEQLTEDSNEERELHRCAARYFNEINKPEETIYHWLAASAFTEAAVGIETAGQSMISAGRMDTVTMWIDSLPPEILAEHPLLQAYLADVFRLRSRFDEALAWYQEAERTWRGRNDAAGISRALRGQARVYIDTVRPTEAESLLQESLRFTDRITDREARARLLELMAENKLNMGKPEEAESLRAEARTLREEGPGEDVLSVRVKLRTGHLEEAQQTLEAWAESERDQVQRGQIHPPRMHRETVLILSLIHSFRGQSEKAFTLAQEGIDLGERLRSPFVTAVGHMRLGHARQLRIGTDGFADGKKSRDEAIQCYESAIALGDRLAVRRTRAEAMWGLTRAYGFFGELDSAERAAAEGVEIGQWAGDAWIVALVQLALGASYALAGQSLKAIAILSPVLASFRDCGDSFGRAATRLWLALAYKDLHQDERFERCVERLLAICERHGYDFLFKVPTLLGPPDPRCLVPILIEARDRRCRPAYASRLLTEIGLPGIEHHPGYQLRVQTLGEFRIWRGQEEVTQHGWRRDKARQLFHLFLTSRYTMLDREQIIEMLWPELDPEATQRDFKVALNTLYTVLEPGRESGAPSAYIIRKGTAYGLRPEADLWLDVSEFEHLVALADECKDLEEQECLAAYQRALDIYQGDFLQEYRYQDFSRSESERLLSIYLRVLDEVASMLIDQGKYQEAIEIIREILSCNNCWERAYYQLMVAYLHLGNRAEALRVYLRCEECLRTELDAEPSTYIKKLHEQLIQDVPLEHLAI